MWYDRLHVGDAVLTKNDVHLSSCVLNSSLLCSHCVSSLSHLRGALVSLGGTMAKVKQEQAAPSQCLNMAMLKQESTSPAQSPARGSKKWKRELKLWKLALALSPSPKRTAFSAIELLRGAHGDTEPPLDVSEPKADTAQSQDEAEHLSDTGGTGGTRGASSIKRIHNAYAQQRKYWPKTLTTC